MPSLTRIVREIVTALWRGLNDSRVTPKRRWLILGGFIASGLRLAAGMTVGRMGARPSKRLVLWDFESCAQSRVVREALSALDLDADVRPCPKNGKRFRPELQGRSVPQLSDPNHERTLNGDRDIVTYLYATYGRGSPPPLSMVAPLTWATGLIARLFTGDMGALARNSRFPALPLELWSFEASPFCRMVRARLCELELPYTLHNVAKGSPRRPEFIAVSGKMQMPWLHDANTGTKLFESQAIEDYLEATYAAPLS